VAGKEKTILQLDGEINLKADKAKQSMQELKNLLNEFKNKTIDVKAQTRSARMSIQNLGDFISRTFNKDNVVKLSTADAQAKADRLLSTLRSFKDFTKITLSLDAKGVSSQLQSIRNDLNFITGKHTISLNATTAQVKSQLAGLSKDINNLKNVSFTINVKNNADLKGINTFTKDMSKLAGLKSDITFGITVKSVQNSLDRVRQVSNVLANLKNNNSIQFTESGLNPILGKLKNMELYLRSIKQNSKIKIEASGAKDLPKLKVEADQSDLFAVEKRLAIITNQIRRINRMTLRVNTRYNNRSGGGGSRGGGSSGTVGGDRWYNSSDATQFIHFLGRSSKGLGSFGEALADVLAKGNAAGGSLSKLTGTASIAAATIGGMLVAGNLLIGAINNLASALGSIAQLVATALKPGFELMAQRDTTMLTTKAALKTSATVNGRAVTNEEATAESAYLFSRAMQEAAKTVLNLNDILTAQQGVLPMLLNKGMTPKQAQDVIFGVAGVAKTGRLAPNQVLQETRDLAQGSITARTSQVANILGITNQDLAQFKGNVDALYEYLMKKFQEYTKVMEEYANTPVGAIEQLQETWGIAAMTIVDEYGPLIVETAQTITKSLGQFDEQGNFHLSDWLKELADGLLDIVVYATSCADALLNMIQSIVGGSDPIETMVNFIKDMIGALTTLIGTLLGVIKIFKMLWAVMKSGVSLIEGLVKGFIGLTQAFLGWVNAKLGNESKANEYAEASKTFLSESKNAFYAFSDVEGQYNNTIDTGWTGNKKTNGFDTYLGESGKLTKKVIDLIDRARNRDIPKGRDVPRMKGTAQDKEDEKARNKAIQAAQKAMKAHIQGLKEQLKDHIANLKETLAKNKIAFDEGFMSIREYYTQKAQIEREEAEAKLQEALAEKAEIEKTPFKNEDDQRKELHKLNREISQYTRELNKAVRGQQEVAAITKAAAEKFADVGAMHDNLFATQMGRDNLLLNAQTTSGMSNTEIVYRQLTQGGLEDNMVRGIIASLMGESGRYLDTNTIGDNGTSFGIAQWHNERWDGLKQFAKDNFSDINHILTQSAYLLHEIWTTESGAFAQALKYYNDNGRTIEAAVEGWTRYVERPADKVGQAQARKDNIKYVNQDLANASNTARNVVSGVGDALTSEINKWLGTPYYLGNDLSRGIDCSKFVQEVYKGLGVEIVRTADEQARQFNDVGAFHLKGSGYQPKRGDFVSMYFGGDYGVVEGQKIGHTGIYNGDGTITHASSGRGKVVTVPISDLESGIVGYGDLASFSGKRGYNVNPIRMSQANTSETASAYLKAINEARKKVLDSAATLESYQLNKIDAQLKKLESEYKEKLNSVDVQGLEGDIKDKYIQEITVDYQKKVADLTISVAKRTMDYNLSKIQSDWEGHLFNLSTGKISFDEFDGVLENYFNYFYNTKGDGGGTQGGIWGVFKYLTKITNEAKFYLAHGMNELYQQSMSEVKKVMNNFKDMMNSGLEAIRKPFDNALDIFTASDKYTTLQKEYGERQLKSWQGQAEADFWDSEISRLAKVKDGLEKAGASADALLIIDRQLWDATQAREKAKLIAEQYPNYLRDLRVTAKQALEDGLVTFLTDGINEAENLGEALRNLAINFLKTIQKFSAERMVKSMMDKWFGGYEIDNPQSLHINNSDFGRTSAEVQADIRMGAQGVAQALRDAANIIKGEAISSYGGLSVANNAVSYSGTPMPTLTSPAFGYQKQTYELPALANSQFGSNSQQSISFNGANITQGSLQQFNEKLQETSNTGLSTFSTSLSDTAQNVSNLSQNITDVNTTPADTQQLGQAMQQASTTVAVAATEIQTTATTMTTGLQTAFMQLEIQAKAAAQALSNIAFRLGGFAEGGYISGPGTSTSDSIPAMLSNGEFVVRKSMVDRYGRNFMESVNNGTFAMIRPKVRHYASGGLVSELAQEQTARGLSNFGKDVGTNISNTANISVALVRDEQEGMKQLLRSPEGQRIMLDFSRRYASVTSRF